MVHQVVLNISLVIFIETHNHSCVYSLIWSSTYNCHNLVKVVLVHESAGAGGLSIYTSWIVCFIMIVCTCWLKWIMEIHSPHMSINFSFKIFKHGSNPSLLASVIIKCEWIIKLWKCYIIDISNLGVESAFFRAPANLLFFLYKGGAIVTKSEIN